MAQTHRIAAIDVLRALTMVWMLFVNDIPGLEDVPHWLFHAKVGEDMLGFSDLVFPAFLFCVGMSIPFAIESRQRRGATLLSTVGHIVARTVALVVMGLFMMNCDAGAGNISYPLFSLLMTAAFFLIWIDYPRRADGSRKWLTGVLQGVGLTILLGMWIYCIVVGKPFRIGWWGILGLIGWTYAVCAFTYLLTRGHLTATIMVWVLFAALCILNQTEAVASFPSSRIWLLSFIPGGWTHHTLGVSGIVASLLLKHYAHRSQHGRLILVFLLLSVLFLGAGLFVHRWWIIAKIFATPTWLFLSLAVNFALLAVVYWVTDVCGLRRWFVIIAPAGTATLTCYLIPYIWYPVQQLCELWIPGWQGLTGILISIAYALIVVQVTRLFVLVGMKVRL